MYFQSNSEASAQSVELVVPRSRAATLPTISKKPKREIRDKGEDKLNPNRICCCCGTRVSDPTIPDAIDLNRHSSCPPPGKDFQKEIPFLNELNEAQCPCLRLHLDPCLSRVYSLLDNFWDLLIALAEGHFFPCSGHTCWGVFCLILPCVWMALVLTLEYLKHESVDGVLLVRYFIVWIASIYIVWNRDIMFERFYLPRFLDDDRNQSIICSFGCMSGTEEKAKKESMCSKILHCKEEERISTDSTCNGLIVFLGAVGFSYIIWRVGEQYLDGNCLRAAYCEIKNNGLVELTQGVEVVLMYVLLIQGFAVGFQLLQFLSWGKLLLWTLRRMVLHHVKDTQCSFVGYDAQNDKPEWKHEFGRKISLWREELPKNEEDKFDDRFWATVKRKYKKYLWNRTRLTDLDDISLEKIYNFHQYVSVWMRQAPGQFHFNSIYNWSAISLLMFILCSFYSIIAQAEYGHLLFTHLPLVLGTVLLSFIITKVSSVNALGEEVIKMYSILELEIIDKELSMMEEQDRSYERKGVEHCVVELLTTKAGESLTERFERMDIVKSMLKQMKAAELTIVISFPSTTCKCFEFRIRKTHVISFLVGIVGPVGGLFLSTVVAPALSNVL